MNTNLTYIAFILDRSGSMGSMAEEAISGFNSFLADQRKEAGEATLSLILFDHEYSPVMSNTPVHEMPELTSADYVPRGMTALLDAMGRTIDELGEQLAAMPEPERPGTVIVVTLTDGMENASKDYSYETLGTMIERQKTVYNWEFLFLGADLRSTVQAARFNLDRRERVQFDSVAEGMVFSSQHISRRRREERAK